MDRDLYASALDNALKEVKKAYPDIKHSFIFSEDGTIVTGGPEKNKETMKCIIDSFETLRHKTKAIGNLQGFQINGKHGKLILSNIKDINLVLETSAKLDKTQIFTIIHIIIPTILKTLETVGPSPIISIPSKKLEVHTLGGLFAGSSVEIDAETLMDWTKNKNSRVGIKTELARKQNMQESIKQVQIETSEGRSACCNVKEINHSKLKGKNVIRVPKKLCKTLKIEKGDLVIVKPTL